MKSEFKYCILLVLISGLLMIPEPSYALFGVADFGVFDFFDSALGGIEELAGPVAKGILQVFATYIISFITLLASGTLLHSTIGNAPAWLAIGDSLNMVRSGWTFTSGLANMFIILILMVIALAFILERETTEMKKALPRLLMIALLINFSLVFVEALLDISNILYNTILQGNEDLVLEIMNVLGGGMNQMIGNLIAWFLVLATTFLIPFLAPFAQLGLIISIVGSIMFLPNILIWITQIFCAFLLSGIFFTYTFLFAARVFVIKILAILAPLAFLSYILPQTKKYWDEWLQHLIQWTFFGITLLFFLVIGLRATKQLMPPMEGVLSPIPIVNWFTLPDYVKYYFFLFVYLVVALFVSRKSMPALAQTIIDQGKSLGGTMRTRILRPVRKEMGTMAAGAPTEAMKRLDTWVGRRAAPIRTMLKPFTATASTAMLRHRARVREEETKVPGEFEKMSDKDKLRYIESQTSAQKRIALATKMGPTFAKEANDETKARLIKDAESIVTNEQYKKQVEDFIKASPTSFRTSAIHIGLAKDERKAKKELRDMLKEMQEQVKDNDLILEAGVKLKAITKEDIKTNRTEAVTKAKDYFNANEENKKQLTLFWSNTAAETLALRKAKADDIENIADAERIPVRLGSHGWAPKTWQKFVEKFDAKTTKNVIQGPGGLDGVIKEDATNKIADFENFCRKHPRTARFLLFPGAGRELNWKWGKEARERLWMDRPKFEEMLRTESPSQQVQEERERMERIRTRAGRQAPSEPTRQEQSPSQQVQEERERMERVRRRAEEE